MRSARPNGVALTAVAMCPFVAMAAWNLAGEFRTQVLLCLLYGGMAAGAGFYTVWSYWRGFDWARVVVLIASFAIVAEGISSTLEQSGNLVGLMSHPVRFLRFAMAVFLLYWLNARPLRAWFRNVGTAADLIEEHLTGKLCTGVRKHGSGLSGYWRMEFEHEAALTLYCPWRIVLDDNLAFASNLNDEMGDGSGVQALAEPPFDEETPRRLLQNVRVQGVRVMPKTSDLFVVFEMGIEVQTWSDEPSSEQWTFSDPVLTVVAQAKGITSMRVAAQVSSDDSAASG